VSRRQRKRPPRQHWTDAQIELLRRLYPNHTAGALESAIGRSARSIYAKASQLGIHKSAAFLASARCGRLTQAGNERGGATRFPRGHTPWNKGLKGLQIGGQATQFKPGNRPHTWVPIGSERMNDGYRQRKMTDTGYPPRDWRPVHVLLWEEHRGPVPEGHAIVFRNGDRTDIRLENLACISRAELMRRNTRHNLPPEINQVISLRAALVRKINNRSKAR